MGFLKDAVAVAGVLISDLLEELLGGATRDELVSRIRELREQNLQLQDDLHFAATQSMFSARACPLCNYDEGQFLRRCALHERIHELEEALALSNVAGMVLDPDLQAGGPGMALDEMVAAYPEAAQVVGGALAQKLIDPNYVWPNDPDMHGSKGYEKASSDCVWPGYTKCTGCDRAHEDCNCIPF